MVRTLVWFLAFAGAVCSAQDAVPEISPATKFSLEDLGILNEVDSRLVLAMTTGGTSDQIRKILEIVARNILSDPQRTARTKAEEPPALIAMGRELDRLKRKIESENTDEAALAYDRKRRNQLLASYNEASYRWDTLNSVLGRALGSHPASRWELKELMRTLTAKKYPHFSHEIAKANAALNDVDGPENGEKLKWARLLVLNLVKRAEFENAMKELEPVFEFERRVSGLDTPARPTP